MRLNKPVKWIESRRENIQATIHGRGQVGESRVAVKNDGTLLGLKYNVTADLGAYHQLLTPAIPTLTGLMLSGCYKIPAIQMTCTGVFTNKMATDAYRGAGRPEATYVIERMMDHRRRRTEDGPGRVAPQELPQAGRVSVRHGDRSGLRQRRLRKGARQGARRSSDYKKLREEQKAARAQGR